jgi:hypothetical protein
MKTSRLERISNHVEVIMNLNLNKFDYIVFVIHRQSMILLVCMLLLYALECFLEEHFKIELLTL